MSALPESTPVAGGAPLTKFRAPRPRRDTVPRPALLARLLRSVESNPVTLVCAPGGSGKSTLLAQLAAGAGAERAVVWAAIDADDDDANRLFATLAHAVEPLGLTWDGDPRLLMANVSGSGAQTRAALAALVNALCTARAPAIALVLDDFHRIEDADALALVESLVERLPAHVALVIGTRREPALPLARWRVHGELGDLTLDDLRFSEEEALALAAQRTGAVPDPGTLRAALKRTHGWAVGLSMALQAHHPAPAASGRRGGEGHDRHLFAYLAQEILAELPPDLQEFALRSAVLDELRPALCAAVTGRSDAAQVLDALFRRDLFLTAVDESVPVLRFHDLFREFLENELERRHPDLAAQIHERAGRAETVPARAIAHLLRARCWNDAMALVELHGEGLLAEGGLATLERWIDAIPADVRAGNARIAYLRGVCAWLRWDWMRAKQELVPAVEGLTRPEQNAMRVRARFDLVDALTSTGEGTAAWNLLETLSQEPLEPLHRAEVALHRAWCMLAIGNPAAVTGFLQEFVSHVERAPGDICPRTAERIHCLCIGLPGVSAVFERFFAACEAVGGRAAAPWQMAALAVGAWAHLWHGRREHAREAIERAEALLHRFGGIRLIAERIVLVRAIYSAATGQYAAAIAQCEALIESLQSPEAASHRAAWQRAYQHGFARILLSAGQRDAYEALVPALTLPRRASEWPFMDVAADLVRGQSAALRGEHAAAEAALLRAVEGYARFRMPMVYGDPRVALAHTRLARGGRAAAWETFEPVYREVVGSEDDSAFALQPGLLLLEAPSMVRDLLDAAPPPVSRSNALSQLEALLAAWNTQAADEPAASVGPLGRLTDRELEVLSHVASGAGNKHIARALDLSLHTVKRHIANILEKLDCASRGQAADLYRRHSPA